MRATMRNAVVCGRIAKFHCWLDSLSCPQRCLAGVAGGGGPKEVGHSIPGQDVIVQIDILNKRGRSRSWRRSESASRGQPGSNTKE